MERPRGRRQRNDRRERYERSVAAIMVGGAVRVARKRAGMSQAELARRVRTSQPSIARLERGRVSPTIVSLERIAQALGAELVINFEPLSTEGEQAGRAPREAGSDRSG